jgi:hypothetical protein
MPAFRVAVPIAVPPSEKTTEPVGVPAEEPIVAVRVTGFCTRTGFGEAVNPAAGAPLFTVMECVTSVATE